MSESNHDNPNLNNPLSQADERRLKSFMRDADAIIAAARGLNSVSRMKLESLAKHHQLSDRLSALALDQLQNAASQLKQLSRYEQAFADFLDHEFGQLKGDVLSLRAEQKALEIATTKYQLSTARAEQLIAQRAQLAALVRIAHSDAENYAQQFLGERIGDRLVLDDELRATMIDRGHSLGLAPARTLHLIERLLEKNRRQRRSRWPKRWVIAFFLTVLFSGLGWIAWIWLPSLTSTLPHTSVESLDQELSLELPAADEELVPWLSPGTYELIDRVERQSNLKRELKTNLTDQDPLNRAAGYRQLTALVYQPQLAEHDADDVSKLLASFFYEEPDSSVVFESLDPLMAGLQAIEIETTNGLQHFEQQYRFNRIIAQIYFYRAENRVLQSLGEPRRQQLAQRMQQETGVSPEGLLNPEYLQQAEAALATRQWNALLQNCWTHPGQVAALVRPTLDLTRNKLAPQTFSQLRTRLLHSLLETNPNQWINVEQPVADAIAVADRSELVDWLDLIIESRHSSFQKFAAPLLQKKLNVPSRSTRLNDILESLGHFFNDYENQKLQPLLTRNNTIESETLEFLATLSQASQPMTPDRIAQIALLVNSHSAVCQQLQRGVIPRAEELLTIDQLLNEPRIRLREIVSLPGGNPSTVPLAAPTASDVNRKNEALRQLTNPGADQQNTRLRQLAELEKIADRFDDLSYNEGQILARYFLGETSDQESLNIQQRISSFSHWPTLGLAIADQIAETPLEPDQAFTIVRRFWGREFSIDATHGNWPEDLRLEIIRMVAQDLARKAESSGNTQTDWTRLRFFLGNLYRQRHLLYQPPDQPPASPLTTTEETEPAEILLDWAANFFDPRLYPVSLVRRVERVSDFIRNNAHSDLQQTVLAGQLLLDLLAQPGGQTVNGDADPIQKLILEIKNKNQPQWLGDRLFLMELDFLKVYSSRRQALILSRQPRRYIN